MAAPSLPALWIDGYAFGTGVLRGGEEPWKTPDDLGFFLRDLAQLLSLDLVEVPVLPAILAWGEMEGVALGSLGADGMERLMADTRFRAHLKRGLETAAGALGSRALALSLPGPGALAALCVEADEVDEDALDDLSLSLADLLRALYRPELSTFRFAESNPPRARVLRPAHQCRPPLRSRLRPRPDGRGIGRRRRGFRFRCCLLRRGGRQRSRSPCRHLEGGIRGAGIG